MKAFEGLGPHFKQDRKVTFTEVILSQQTLAQTYAKYLDVLNAAWQAVAELMRLTQIEPPADEPALPGGDSWPDPAR